MDESNNMHHGFCSVTDQYESNRILFNNYMKLLGKMVKTTWPDFLESLKTQKLPSTTSSHNITQ